MAQKAFKKGDRVTRISDWDGKGTVAIREAIVHSCGVKRLILTDATTGEEIGRNFRAERNEPEDRLESWGGGFAQGLIFPALDRDVAIKIALESGAAIVASVRANAEKRIADEAGNAGFINAMNSKIVALHEPRFIVGEG